MPVDTDSCFDLLRGVAAFTGEPIVADLARALARHPDADLSIAFNHKQVASKIWARDALAATLPGGIGRAWVLGGWYGVLSAFLLGDARLGATHVTSLDVDPAVAAVALTLNARHVEAGRFAARTADMRALDYADAPDLVVNTSCEHLPDVPAWLATVPPGTTLLLQSNDYTREPDHRSCVPDLAAFRAQAGLADVWFEGALPTRNYTRFMLIGRR